MDDQFRDQWNEFGGRCVGPLRRWAWRIRDHGRADLEMLWHLVDFAQVCVKYPALLLLARSFHDPQVRDVLFRRSLPDFLERPLFGHWMAFVRESLEGLGRNGIWLPFPMLQQNGDCLDAVIGNKILPLRNQLAHGPGDRFLVAEDRVRRVSDQLFSVIGKLGDLYMRPLERTRDRVLFPADAAAGGGTAVELYPFLVAGDNGDALLYDQLKDKDALFFSGESAVKRRDLRKVIGDYLASGRLPYARKLPDQLTREEMLDRSSALVREFRRAGRFDFFFTDCFFSELPPFGGRPGLGGHLVESLGDGDRPLVYLLYGRRGSGKRPLLGDVLRELQQAGHLCVPLRADRLPDEPLQSAFNRALEVEGTLDDLAAAAVRTAPGASLVLVINDLPGLLTQPGRADQLAELLRGRARWGRTHFLFLCDTTEPIRLPLDGPEFIPVPMPPMEDSACAELYARVSSRPFHAPLSEWQLLPPAARDCARNPADLVQLCRKFHERSVPDEFHEFLDREDTWEHQVQGRADRVTVLREMAERMLATGQRSVSVEQCPALAAETPAARRTRVELQALGLITDTLATEDGRFVAGMGFVDYHWLVRSLLLTGEVGALDQAASGESWQQLVAHCERFPPLYDALALWAASRPGAETAAAFARGVACAGDSRGRLIEGLLARAYPDADLLEQLVQAALATDDEGVLDACGAAAQQMIAAGRADARETGLSIQRRLLECCRARGYESLEARLLYELARCDPAADSEARRRSWTAAREKALATGQADLEQKACNQLAALALTEAQRTDPRRRELTARQIIGRLAPFAAAPENPAEWRTAGETCQLLARCHGLLSGEDSRQASALLRRALDLARRFGGAADIASAHDALSCRLADEGRFGDALEHGQEAVQWAKIGGSEVDTAACLAHTALIWRKCSAVQPTPEERAQSLLNARAQYRQAKRILERCGNRQPAPAMLAQLWANMAVVLEQLGEIGQAQAAAEESIARHRLAGNVEQSAIVEQYLGRLRRDRGAGPSARRPGEST